MKRLCFAMIAVLLLATVVCGTEIIDAQSAALPLTELDRALSGETKDLLGDHRPDSAGSFADGIGAILSKAFSGMTVYLRNGVSACVKILLIAVISGAFLTLDTCRIKIAVLPIGALAICLCVLGDARAMLKLGQSALTEYAALNEALLPVISAASAASGASVASAGLYGVAVFFFHLLSRLMTSVLLPLLPAVVGLAACDAALGQTRLSGVRDAMIGFAKGSMKAILIAFTGFLTVTGVTAGSADAAALKAARFGITTAVPVVGSIAADASESVLTGMRLLRDSVGTFGMLSAVAVGIVPFLRIGVQYLLLNGTSALCAVTGAKELSDLVRTCASALGILAAMTGVCALFVFLSVICFMKVVVL